LSLFVNDATGLGEGGVSDRHEVDVRLVSVHVVLEFAVCYTNKTLYI